MHLKFLHSGSLITEERHQYPPIRVAVPYRECDKDKEKISLSKYNFDASFDCLEVKPGWC